jgi:hypothetical protein
MAMRINDAQRNRVADSFASSFDGGTLAIYTGAQPATAATAASGTLLATITLPNPAFSAAAAGVASKTGTWTDTVDVSGQAGWARFVSSAGDRRMDVDVGQGAGELSLDEDDLVAGGTVTVTTFTVTQPAA